MDTRELLESLLTQAEEAHAAHERETGQRDEHWQAWYAAFIETQLSERGLEILNTEHSGD